jgi:hypothetical protein
MGLVKKTEQIISSGNVLTAFPAYLDKARGLLQYLQKGFLNVILNRS